MLIIFHSADLDGVCSAAILHKKFPEARLLGYDYNQPFDVEANIGEYEKVIMADVSMPMNVMEEIAFRSECFVWIDHHVPASGDFLKHFDHVYIDGRLQCVGGRMMYFFDNTISACEACWNYAFPDQPMPETVKLLGMYDTWRGNGTPEWDDVILPFQYGMRLRGDTPKTLAEWLDSGALVTACINSGGNILKYQKQQDARLMQKSFDAVCKFRDRKIRCLVCNGAYNSTAFESKWDESKYDMMVGISFNGKVWSLSLHTTKDDVDCSVIAKEFGGGGHKKASGCAVENLSDFIIF